MIDDTRHLSQSIAIGISAVGLLVAVMIAIQLSLGVITWDYYPHVIVFTFISNFLVLQPLVFLAVRKHAFLLPALIWTHVSMSIMLLYFSQTYSPFTAAWSILILISSIYYGWKGFALSCVSLGVTAAGYVLLFPQNTEQFGGVINYSFLSVLVVSVTVFTSYLFLNIIMSSRKKNRELEKVQQSEQLQINRLNTLLNSISDAVVTLNRYGRITSQNAAAQAFFDTNQSLIGRDIDQVLELRNETNKQIKVRDVIRSVKTTIVREDFSSSTGGEKRHLSLQISRIRSTFDDKEEYGVVLIIRDITKQKSLEEEKDEFISVTSHELRTPVAIAEGSLSNLLFMYERKMDEAKLVQAAEDAHTQIVYLAKMINDLSTLSRAERGVGDVVEEIDVTALLHDLYARYAPEAEAKSLHLNLDMEPSLPAIKTSRLYLEEIVQNFITNAIKYTKTGSVTLGAKMESDDTIRFFVSDTGIGMSKYDLAHIFGKFYRSEDYRTRETSGTGLGLYVVTKLAQKLNTKINVESRLNHGSTFSFVMPLQTSFTKKAPAPTQTEETVAETVA